MFFSKKGPKRVGASEKLRHAQLIKSGYLNEQVTSKREGHDSGPLAPTLLVYFVACALAYVMSVAGPMKSGLGWHPTGISALDSLVFGSALAPDLSLDFILMIAARGLFFFLLAGVLPLLTWVFVRLIDRKQDFIFLTFWGVSLGAPLLIFLVVLYVIPLLVELYKIFFT